MYWDHFSLSKLPFAITPDPSMMVWTKQHAQVYEALKQEALAGAPLTLLTGDAGCGKTTVLKALLADPVISESFRTVLISIRLGSVRELLQHLLIAFQGRVRGRLPEGSDEDYLLLLRELLDRLQPSGQSLIVLDEVQAMGPDVAMLLGRLARGELTSTPPPAVVIVGHTELTGLINGADGQPLSSAIGQRLRLGPLSSEDVPEYIFGRLKSAGYEGKALFDAGAIDKVHEYSQGVPGLVNRLCDLCLFKAAQQNCQVISCDLTREVVTQLSPLGYTLDTPKTESNSLDVRAGSTVLTRPAATVAEVNSTDDEQDATADAPLPPEPVKVTGGSPGLNFPVKSVFEPQEASRRGMPTTPAKLEAVPPRPHSTVFGYLRGSLVAAAFGVPLLLTLPQLESPLSSSLPVSLTRIESGNDALAREAPVVTSPVEPQALRTEATSFGDEADATTFAIIVEPDESGPAALSQSVFLMRAESDAPEVKLQQIPEFSERVALEPAAAPEELAAMQLEASVKHAAPETSKLQIATEQNQIASLSQDVSTTEESLTAILGDIGTSQKLKAPAELVARSAFQPVTIETFGSATADDIPQQAAGLAIAPLMPTGDEGAAFFESALESTEPVEIALNYARAAIRGHTRAAIYLGQLFETGDGVNFDADMAQRWYRTSENMEGLHQPDLSAAAVGSVSGPVETLGTFVSGDTADLIWQGKASVFSMQLADADVRPIAYLNTSLNAVRVALPEGARFWRVTTTDGTSSDWQPLDTSTD